jgi:hypothetical protein
MRKIWNPSIDDVIEAIELARSQGVKAGESYEKQFLEVMEKKGKKPSCSTELNNEELLQEYLSHGKGVAHIQVDSEGVETIKVMKPKKENDNIEE